MSTDSRFTHKMWKEEELSKMVEGGIPYPMLSDPGGRIGTVYGVYDEAAGVGYPRPVHHRPDGVIQAMEVLTPTVGRNVAESFARSRPSSTCGPPARSRHPAGQPGKPH